MDHDISCVIPRWGRTFVNIMHKLAPLADNRDEILEVVNIVSAGKQWAASTPHEVSGHGVSCPYVCPAPDRKRPDRPFRIGFLGMTAKLGGIRLRLEGDEPHNGSSLIKLDEVDFTIVGLDELLAMNHQDFKDPSIVTKWGLYNYQLRPDNSLRIVGSANLTAHNATVGRRITDFIGFFLISTERSGGYRPDFKSLVTTGMPVFVKGRYEGLVRAILPGVNTTPTSNVEDAVLSEKAAVGIEIIQSGKTVREKGLRVFGRPLFLSESLYVADYRRYLEKGDLRDLLEILSPQGYFDEERLKSYTDWFAALEATLGSAWHDRPRPDELFCSIREMKGGLRPFRLKTRRWMPSDHYKRYEAEALVATSLRKIQTLYREVSHGNDTAGSVPDFQ